MARRYDGGLFHYLGAKFALTHTLQTPHLACPNINHKIRILWIKINKQCMCVCL